MTNPVLSLFTEKTETVQRLVDKKPELAEHIEMLEKFLIKQYEDIRE